MEFKDLLDIMGVLFDEDDKTAKTNKTDGKFSNRIIVETYDYGTKYVDGYKDMSHFENAVFMNQGYFITTDNMIISSTNIKAAYYEYGE